MNCSKINTDECDICYKNNLPMFTKWLNSPNETHIAFMGMEAHIIGKLNQEEFK